MLPTVCIRLITCNFAIVIFALTGLTFADELASIRRIQAAGGKIVLSQDKARQTADALSIRGMFMTDTVMKNIQQLKDLRRLNITGPQITDDHIKELEVLKNLELVDLADARVTNASMIELQNFPNLQSLYLYGTAVTELRQPVAIP